MNKVILIGRLTKDVDVKTTQNGVAYASFTIAVDRKFKNANGQRETDFIMCTAWRQTAQFIGQYFAKGNRIAVVGSIQTRTVEDESGKRYITEVVCDEAEFVENKQPTAPAAPIAPPMPTAPANPKPATFDMRPKPPRENVTLADLEPYGELPFELE